MFPVVAPVASQLSWCVDASAPVDPLSESTLLAVGAVRLVDGQSLGFTGFLGMTASAPQALQELRPSAAARLSS